jgi:SAM-dependent methyltransferase
MTNTIGYVSTQQTQTTEEMNTDLDLNSSVELVFKTDYLPLDRMAGRDQVDRIKVNTLNPEAELKAAQDARSEREKRHSDSETARRTATSGTIKPPPAPPPAPKPGEPGSAEAAEKARQDAAKKAEEDAKKDAAKKKTTTATTSGLAEDEPHAVMKPTRTPDVIFAPSPEDVAGEMLALANVTAQDYLIDLGCGDGEILVAAARKYGCRALGIDIDPRRVAEARQKVQRAGLQDLVRVEQGDLFDADLGDADVVMLYLLPHLNVRLIPQLQRLKPGARIVSQDFGMEGVIADRVTQVFLPQRRIKKTFYLWTAPLRMADGPVKSEWSNANPLRVA